MKKTLLTAATIAFFSCQNSQTQLKINAKLPKDLKEISGVAYNNNQIYCIADSGNKNQVWVLDESGVLIKKIKINDVENVDWEDLTFDTEGNLYIGDFGNNDNVRKDLVIYKIDKSNLNQKKTAVSYLVSFDYPEQKDFPPKKKNLLFDVEAFFEYNHFFYLFTKNRSKDFDGSSYVYKIPNTAGHHHAQLIQTINTCSDYQNCAITSAAISPSGTKFVLLSHSKIWLFDNFNPKKITEAKISALHLNHFSQKEAVCFKNNNTLLFADERVNKSGGNLYSVLLENLKE